MESKIKRDLDDKYITTKCFICGFDMEQQLEEFDDCHCCGVINSYWITSTRITTPSLYREDWFKERNCKFHIDDFQPEGWNEEMAIKQIKENVPEEFWINDPLVTGK